MNVTTFKSIIVLLFLAIAMTACTYESGDTPTPTPNPNPNPSPSPNPSPISATIWSGSKITFEKANGADPSIEANQDRITDNVWITRGNSGGQIFNAAVESSSNKSASPSGTQWAIGTTDNLENLTFANFRTTVGQPKNIVGRDLVLLLVEDSIAIDIKITSWSRQRRGGFAYERSSE